jgi:homoserine O-acetyltransferase
MNSHDVGRGRESAEAALRGIKVRTLVAGIDSDRLFPIANQEFIADNLTCEMVGGGLNLIESEYGHDGFLIEREIVGPLLAQLLDD